MNTGNGQPLLEVRNLKKHFLPQKKLFEEQAPPVRAVDGISFTLQAGETLGLVGESGCGKSTAARTLLRLIEPSSGQVNFFGTNLFGLKEAQMRNLRKEMQIISRILILPSTQQDVSATSFRNLLKYMVARTRKKMPKKPHSC